MSSTRFSFIHSADWQIGKQFGSIAGDAGALLRSQRLKTVHTMAALATQMEADAVLVAGDVFEDNAVADETLRRTLHALTAFAGPWVFLPGNHDASLVQSVWSRLHSLGIPDNVILALTPTPISLGHGRAMVLPAPLTRRHESIDLTDYYDHEPTAEGVYRIGLAHGSVTGRLAAECESMNPIADDRTRTARLDYLALGDWHGTLSIAERTWYAGTPEPDRFKENDAGNILRVVLETPGSSPTVEKIAIGHYRWRMLSFEVLDTGSIAVLDGQLAALGEPHRLLLRLRLTGACDLENRQGIETLLDSWQARLHYLEVDAQGLQALPSQDDILAMGAHGFVQDAINTLQAMQANPLHPNRTTAMDALRILYREQLELRQLRH